MQKGRISLLILMVWALTCTSALALGFEAALGMWQQTPSGDIAYKAESSGDSLNIEDDLDYGAESRLHLRAKIDLPLFLPNIYLMAAPAEFEADGEKSVPFKFGDVEFDANVPFSSKLTYNQYDVALYYGLPFIKTATLGKLNIDVGLNLRFIEMEGQIEQDDTDIDEKESISIVVPQLYVGAQVEPLDWLAFEVEGRLISISDNVMYSLIGRARFKVFGPAFAAVGYRQDQIDVDQDDIEVELSLQGPFLEAGLKF